MTNKPSRNINEQIELLKSRGMLFRNEAAAKDVLKSVSYYRLKGYWWDMQSDKTQHVFIPNSYFEDVVGKYEFDRELRLVLFYAIEIIEIALRTKMIYHLSQAYGGLWYLNDSLFENIHLFEQHRNELQDEFGLNFHNELSSWLESVSYLRNIVAHHSRVWSRTMVKTPMRVANPNHPWLQIPLSTFQAKRPFYVISAMLYLCNAVQSDNLFKSKILDLFAKYPTIPLYKLGFNNQWRQEDIWK